MIIVLLILELLQQPTIDMQWVGSTLIVTASPGSLYLIGGDRHDTYIGQGLVILPTKGIDHNRNPHTRTAIILKDNNGSIIAITPIRYTVILPIIDTTEETQ